MTTAPVFRDREPDEIEWRTVAGLVQTVLQGILEPHPYTLVPSEHTMGQSLAILAMNELARRADD